MGSYVDYKAEAGSYRSTKSGRSITYYTPYKLAMY